MLPWRCVLSTVQFSAINSKPDCGRLRSVDLYFAAIVQVLQHILIYNISSGETPHEPTQTKIMAVFKWRFHLWWQESVAVLSGSGCGLGEGKNNLKFEPCRFGAGDKQRRVGVKRGREAGSPWLTAESVLSRGKPPASFSPLVLRWPRSN